MNCGIFWLQSFLAFLILLETIFISVSCDPKASGFPGSFPLEVSEETASKEIAHVDFDSDVNIPGRHFPRLAYTRKFRKTNHQMYSPKFGNKGQTLYMQNYEADFGVAEDGVAAKPPSVGPYFDRNLQRNVSVQVGKTAVLTCRVLNIGDKSVSWIRLSDLHILTVNNYKYNRDPRVSVVMDSVNHDWILRLKDVTYHDAGKYECQISTEPILSFIVNLEVFDESQVRTHPSHSPKDLPKGSLPNRFSDGKSDSSFSKLNDGQGRIFPRESQAKAYIRDGPDIHVHPSSLMINLTCVVQHGTHQLVSINWYHHNKMIDITDPNKDVWTSIINGRSTHSNLVMTQIKESDSGKYTCQPSNGDSTSITLHVHSGDVRAAMQSNATTNLFCKSNKLLRWIFSLLFYYLLYAYGTSLMLDTNNLFS